MCRHPWGRLGPPPAAGRGEGRLPPTAPRRARVAGLAPGHAGRWPRGRAWRSAVGSCVWKGGGGSLPPCPRESGRSGHVDRPGRDDRGQGSGTQESKPTCQLRASAAHLSWLHALSSPAGGPTMGRCPVPNPVDGVSTRQHKTSQKEPGKRPHCSAEGRSCVLRCPGLLCSLWVYQMVWREQKWP